MQQGNAPRRAIREVILFLLSIIIGISLPTIVQLFFNPPKNDITTSGIIIILIVMLLTAACSYILYLIEKRTHDTQIMMKSITKDVKDEMRSIISRIEDFEYAQDFEHDWKRGRYEGRVFKKLTRLVADSRFSIDAISLSSITHENFFPNALEDRKNYFDEIVNTIRDHHDSNKPFIYRRVFQLNNSKTPDIMRDHHYKVDKFNNNVVKCYIKYIETTRLTGLVLIDKEILVFIINGIVGDQGQYYPVALLIFKKGAYSELINSYAEYFEETFNRANPTVP